MASTHWSGFEARGRTTVGLRPAGTVLDFFARQLTGLALAVTFLISPMVLYQAGLRYEEAGGGALEKIHPGSLVMLLALLLKLLAYRPVHSLYASLRDNPGLAIYVVTTAFLIGYTILVQNEAFTPLIDTFIPVIAIFLLMKDCQRLTLDRFATMLHLIFAANALLALFEYLSGARLTPYVAGAVEIGEDDWRSTALFGHPLANALLTGCYILLLASRGGAGLPTFQRAAMLVLQLGSMVAFGARASLVTMLLMLGILATLGCLRLVTGQMRLSLRFLGLLAMAVPVVVAASIALAGSGFFDRLIDRFLDDNGSASARIAMFALFEYIPVNDILFGPDPALIASLKSVEGVEAGIESFWVAFALTYGLLPSLLFFVGLFAFSINICLRIRPFSFYVFAFFFAVSSTSVSLSAKSPLFGMVVAMMFVMLRPLGRDEHRSQSLAAR